MTQCWWWSRYDYLFNFFFSRENRWLDATILRCLFAILSISHIVCEDDFFFCVLFGELYSRLGVCVFNTDIFPHRKKNPSAQNLRTEKKQTKKKAEESETSNRRKEKHTPNLLLILLRESIYNGMPFVALHLLRTLWIVSDDYSIASWQFIISRSQRKRECMYLFVLCSLCLFVLFFLLLLFRFFFFFLELIALKMKTYALVSMNITRGW